MNHEEHMRLLGEATGRSQQLELCTAQILARALGVEESVARLLASKMGHSALLNVLAELATKSQCGRLDAKALASWARQAQVANQARNRVIHSPWIAKDDGDIAFILANGSMAVVARNEDDLREDIAALEQAVHRALELF